MAESDFVEISMPAALRAQLESYCQMRQAEPSAVVDSVMQAFFTEQTQVEQRLAAGYQAMADLNQEICHEFSACECEAEAHIR